MSTNQSGITTDFKTATLNQDLSDLMTVSAGFVDVFKIRCHEQVTIVLPQNLVLAVQTHRRGVQSITWHDVELPVYAVHHPEANQVTALIIENESIEQSFAILCDDMAESKRLRISEVVDVYGMEKEQGVFQYVRIHNELCQIPILNDIYMQITAV